MSGIQDLKELFSRRLLAAVLRDISGQTTTSGYEEELHRQRKLLDVILTPEIKLQRADVQQLLVSKEELPPEQQEWSHILDQEDTKPQHIKEEHEELWSSQEEEQLQGPEEADTTKFPFTPVSVKSEDDEEKPQSSQLHQRQTEQMETGVDGEDCGGAEPERYSDPERGLQPETEVKIEDSDEPETDDSDDWRETREDLSGLNLKNKKLKTGCQGRRSGYSTQSPGIHGPGLLHSDLPEVKEVDHRKEAEVGHVDLVCVTEVKYQVTKDPCKPAGCRSWSR
ncbi:uncharacterized protein LKV04_008342 [Tautogolabrus adspersus]